MDWLRFWEILAIAICLGTIAYACWLMSEQPKFWLWKGSLHALAVLLAAAGLFVIGIAQHTYEMAQPLSEAQGRIEDVRITHSKYSDVSHLKLRTGSGELLSLHAPQWDINFFQGQRMQATYEGPTGLLVSAQFLSGDGRIRGKFVNNRMQLNSWMWSAVFLLVLILPTTGLSQSYARARVGDTVAEQFTPDKPEDHWKFDKGGRLLSGEAQPEDMPNE